MCEYRRESVYEHTHSYNLFLFIFFILLQCSLLDKFFFFIFQMNVDEENMVIKALFCSDDICTNEVESFVKGK